MSYLFLRLALIYPHLHLSEDTSWRMLKKPVLIRQVQLTAKAVQEHPFEASALGMLIMEFVKVLFYL